MPAVPVGPAYISFTDDGVTEADGGDVGLHSQYIELPRTTRSQRRGLIWTNRACLPRHVRHVGGDRTLPAVPLPYIVDPEAAEGAPPILELEHETRAVRHFQFYKDVAFDG